MQIKSETKKEKSKEKARKDKITEEARARYKLAEEAESDNRVAATDDLKYLSGDQWPEKERKARALKGRPCLTVNKLPQFVRQVTNEQRQNRPSIKVSPFDDNADVETARIYKGLIRHIENNSNANTAYNTAFDHSVGVGFGYFRIITDYCDPHSFDQEILIKKIRNQFSVLLDPFHKELDGSDANYGFIIDTVSVDEFKRLYPDSEVSTSSDFNSLADESDGWITANSVKIAEYFYKDYTEIELVQLSDGSVVERSKLPEILPYDDATDSPITEVNSRKSSVPVVKWCKINGVEILEEKEFPCQWIPIIPVYGNEIILNGKKILEGVIRHAKDPQTMHNYFITTETEAIALAPKAPFIGAEGQFSGHEKKWQTANTDNHAYLEYNPKSLNGQALPAPQRNTYEPAIGAITNARMQSSDDIKATTGIYDAALGARSNENSGVAIQRRNQQSQTSNFHFIDNFNQSLRHAGRIVVELIPKIYDAPRTMRILGDDGEEEIVKINQIFVKENGEEAYHDLSVGKYDVTIETGPSFATKRQEAVASMLEFVGAYPASAQVIGDLLAKNMDWPGAAEISERLKKMIPPQLLADDKDGPAQVPPEAKAQMDQMNQMIEQLTASLNEATDKVKLKTLELESRERIELAKMEQQAAIELAKLQSDESVTILQHQIDEINQRQSLVKDDEEINFELDNSGAGQEEMSEIPEQEEQQTTGGNSPGNYIGETL